jgi:hypothetical protein
MITFFEIGENILNQPKDKPPYSSLSPQSEKEQNIVTPKGQYFEIRIKGQLSNVWADWFEGMTIKNLDNEEMLFSGYVVDQSALMGILNKIARLNLTLISLKEIKNNKEKK